eukprot:Awhi_evm1s15316
MFGVSLEEWLNDDGRQIELETDDEYQNNGGNPALVEKKGQYDPVDEVSKESTQSGDNDAAVKTVQNQYDKPMEPPGNQSSIPARNPEPDFHNSNDYDSPAASNNEYVVLGIQPSADSFQDEQQPLQEESMTDEDYVVLGTQPSQSTEQPLPNDDYDIPPRAGVESPLNRQQQHLREDEGYYCPPIQDLISPETVSTNLEEHQSYTIPQKATTEYEIPSNDYDVVPQGVNGEHETPSDDYDVVP